MGMKASDFRTCLLDSVWIHISMSWGGCQCCTWFKLYKLYDGVPRFTQVHLMFTQGREGEGKQRIKMRFYKLLKSKRPFQVWVLSPYMKAKTAVASVFTGSRGKPSRFCEALETWKLTSVCFFELVCFSSYALVALGYVW